MCPTESSFTWIPSPLGQRAQGPQRHRLPLSLWLDRIASPVPAGVCLRLCASLEWCFRPRARVPLNGSYPSKCAKQCQYLNSDVLPLAPHSCVHWRSSAHLAWIGWLCAQVALAGDGCVSVRLSLSSFQPPPPPPPPSAARRCSLSRSCSGAAAVTHLVACFGLCSCCPSLLHSSGRLFG